ncbi:hypothetical protein ABZY57_18050 [Streptomyces sp. NPDC006450]|uniref:hypothetical protein n=1 Tax=Streptomyces sp. NPDC006450 TaxID=3155458 RepID=UPI0033ABE407
MVPRATRPPGRESTTQTLHVVYDPRRPRDNVARRPLPEVLLMHFSGWLLSLGMLATGGFMVAAPFM